MSEKKAKVRLNVDLPADVAQALVDISKQQGVTLSEAVRRAINTESFLHKKRQANAKVLIEEGESIKELVFMR